MAQDFLNLGDLLVKEGLITKEQLAQAIKTQKQKDQGEFLGSILVTMGALTEKNLTMALSRQWNIPYASQESGILKPDLGQNLTQLVPEEFARKHHVLALFRHENSLTVAVADPTDIVVLDSLRKMTNCHIHRVLASAADIDACIGNFYGEGGMLKTAIDASYESPVEVTQPDDQNESLSLDKIVASAANTPVIKLTDLLIRQAIKERASDIHIEPFEDKISIRFRIDGVLHEMPTPEKSMFLPLISRLKILCRMDIAEKRLPQDASFRAAIENRSVDFRVSTVPTVNGEKMVLRILDKRSVALNLETLGFEKEYLNLYREIIHKPYGLILITGPTGSGKTTTLYAALNELNGPDKNIMTVEDPVEYQMRGINQVQVKPNIGLTFAAGLRAFLRQDPDIILVGETRDAETAQICIRAALTGHLVFSTLHTNDAPSTISRLIDIGIEPFFVASSLLMVVAQRLVRKLCPTCKEVYTPSPAKLPNPLLAQAKTLYKPKGCDQCSNTGYRGRMAIYEIMAINERLQEMIAQRSPMPAVRAEARKAGMKTLEESGYEKVLAGLTSVEEVLRVTLTSGTDAI